MAKLTITKSMQKAFVHYVNVAKSAGVHIPAMEALRPFLGKKGQVLKRPTRSKKAKENFEQAKKEAEQKFTSRPSSKKIDKELEERKKKAAEIEKKAAATYRKRKVKEAKQTKGKNVRSVAQKAARQYKQMVGALSDAAMRELMESYGIKSEVIEYLAENGLTSEQIKEFIRQYAHIVDNIPEEARQLAADDQNFKVMQEIATLQNDKIEFDNLADMFGAVINAADDGVDPEKVLDIIEIYAEYKGTGNLPFSEFWEELQMQTDPYNEEMARRVLEGDI